MAVTVEVGVKFLLEGEGNYLSMKMPIREAEEIIRKFHEVHPQGNVGNCNNWNKGLLWSIPWSRVVAIHTFDWDEAMALAAQMGQGQAPQKQPEWWKMSGGGN